MAIHNDLGNKGEELAVAYLIKKGYSILERNYRFRNSEIDIAATKYEVLFAVEVKTRSSYHLGNPTDFINKKKIQLLIYGMDNYIHEHDLDIEVRFDIISVLKDQKEYSIEHIEDAFLFF